jgi:orotate phosphoribosyltransferase
MELGISSEAKVARSGLPRNLFQLGNFTLHSGAKSNYLINCDALTDEELDCIAFMISEKLPWKFGRVEGVPRGGLLLAGRMVRYATPELDRLLIVDDVYTTGRSMEAHRAGRAGVHGAVIFARAPITHNWITPLFRS